jgi:hypothetical protein
MLRYASPFVVAFGVILSSASPVAADPPAVVGKTLEDKTGIKVNSIGEKDPSSTDCIEQKSCKKAKVQATSAKGSAKPEPPGSGSRAPIASELP